MLVQVSFHQYMSFPVIDFLFLHVVCTNSSEMTSSLNLLLKYPLIALLRTHPLLQL